MLRVVKKRLETGETFQLLQQKRKLFEWKTIDSEHVPDHVLISVGCFGDTGGWKSKFIKHGTFGRDGIIREKEGDK